MHYCICCIFYGYLITVIPATKKKKKRCFVVLFMTTVKLAMLNEMQIEAPRNY